MLDLYNTKYSREELKKWIFAVKMMDVLITQTLDVTFIVRYILNPKYHIQDGDEQITIKKVLEFQPHISKERLLREISLYTKDDDSVEDFETISNKI